MTKASTALVATGKGDALPAHLQGSAGRGNEEVGADHLTIPRIKLMQKMSNEVDKHHGDYIEGVDAGDFLNSLTSENLGTEIYVINIKFTDKFVVWKKRTAGGGLLGSFDTEAEAKTAIGEQEKPEDYDITQTHSHLLALKNAETGEISKPVLMDFSSSKLRVSRGWNSQINIRGGDRFAALWKLKSKQVQNKRGDAFMNLEVSFVGWAMEEDYRIAEEYYEAFGG